jgi:hypothetical protein
MAYSCGRVRGQEYTAKDRRVPILTHESHRQEGDWPGGVMWRRLWGGQGGAGQARRGQGGGQPSRSRPGAQNIYQYTSTNTEFT